MIGQRDHKLKLTDTPKASLGSEMDVIRDLKKSDYGNAEFKFWYERHNESQEEGKRSRVQETSSGDHATVQKTGLAGKPKIMISLRTSSPN